MAHTNVFMNWKGVTITPSGGSLVNLTGVMDVQTSNVEGLEPWQADGHLFPTLMIRATAARSVTIMGGDVATMMAVPRGTACTVVAILDDAVNGAGSGALTHTWLNAVVADVPASGPSNKFAGGTITFVCYSSDGTTDPLTVAQAA
jgi:hypothetical protein